MQTKILIEMQGGVIHNIVADNEDVLIYIVNEDDLKKASLEELKERIGNFGVPYKVKIYDVDEALSGRNDTFIETADKMEREQ